MLSFMRQVDKLLSFQCLPPVSSASQAASQLAKQLLLKEHLKSGVGHANHEH